MSRAHVERVVAVGGLSLLLVQSVALAAQSAGAPSTGSQPTGSSSTPQSISRATPSATSPSAPAPSGSTPTTGTTPGASAANRAEVTPPPGYVIGPDDVLGIVFWREKDLSADVVVRPDGFITLPLLEEIKVTGMTPTELKQKITTEAAKLVTSPNVTVIVKQINSRKVFITGHVAKPGSYSLSAPTTVVQLIAVAGGLLEFADRSKIRVMRSGGAETFRVNYKQLAKGEELKQNIELKPGDTVIVP
jgi:polysaccharide biosynthesis/export protein